jgi:hypothetical protein
MRQLGARVVLTLAAALVALLALGCANAEPPLFVATWTVDGATITLPAHLTDAQLFDEKHARKPTVELKARVAIPASLRARELTFAAPHLPAHARLRANGRALALRDADDGSYRGAFFRRWQIPSDVADADAIDFDLAIDDTWAQAGWLDSVPRISATLSGDAGFLAVVGWNQVTGAVGVVSTLVASITYLLLFLIDRSRRAAGWYAFQSLCGAFYPAFALGELTPIFGQWDGPLMATMLGLALVAGVHVSHLTYNISRTSRIWDIWGAAIAIAALFFHDPFTTTKFVSPLLVSLAVIGSAVIVINYVRAARTQRRLDAYMPGTAWACLFVLTIPDGAAWLGLGEVAYGARGGYLGIAIISVAQSLALVREHIVSHRRAEALNVELAQRVAALEGKNREIGLLNTELRRQIGARSSDLADRLARLGDVRPRAISVHEGDVIDERYRVVRAIGEGGMGSVYEVVRVADDRHFALKIVTGRGDGAGLARFAREAQLIAELDHPNVVSIVDIDVASDGRIFLVMELASGRSLEDHRTRYGDSTWALPILRGLARGLTAVHARGIVHRDLKPSNVLVAEDLVVKIADFGIAALDRDRDPASGDADTLVAEGSSSPPPPPPSGATLTQTGVILGTPLYMAPELVLGAKNATGAADVFSFGVIAYEILTGELPFDEAPVAALLARRKAPDAAHFPASVPRALATLFERCLDPEPMARPSAEEIASALSSIDATTEVRRVVSSA